MSRATICRLIWSNSERVYELHPGASDVTQLVEIGSAAWFAWLKQTSSFAFCGQTGSYTARKERRPRGGDGYWYAYARVAGKLTKRYLGRDADLITVRMEQVADRLCHLPDTQARTTQQPTSLDTARASSESPFVPLLATKMHIPHVRNALVPRPQLFAELQQSLSCALTVIIAPAGFGKTTTVSAWLRATSVAAAWLSLEDDDNELQRFWSYVFSALSTSYPDLCTDLLEQLQTPLLHQPQPIEQVLTSFINGLVAEAREVVLVLDDYHTITSSLIHTSLAFLLEHLPPSLHLVLSTRSEPPLPQARLRARAQLLEIRAADLRFTLDEARVFLNTVLALNLSLEEIALLEERTEGWPAALQFAGISLRRRAPGSPVSDALGGGQQRHLVAYLAAEVFQHQPEAVQAFLLSTAILTRLQSDLCAAVTGSVESRAILMYLEEANLFVAPLDASCTWYRYHQLFAEFLSARLREMHAEQIVDLHERAAAWYETHGYLSDALHHLGMIGNSERITRFIEVWSESLIQRGEFALLDQWMAYLPASALYTRPQLCLASAKTLTFLGRLDAAEQRLGGLEERLMGPEVNRPVGMDGEILATRALIATMRMETSRAVELAQQALASLAQEHVFTRSVLTLSLGMAYRLHDADAARNALGEAMRQADNPHMAVMSMCQFAYQLYLQGQLHHAFELYQRALECVPNGQRIPAMSVALLGCGEVQREWNALEDAERFLEEALPLGRTWSFLGVSTGIVVTLARVEQARGKSAQARALLHEQMELAEQQQDLVSLSTLHAYLALLDLYDGQQTAAVRWAEKFVSTMKQDEALKSPQDLLYLILLRVWIVSGQYTQSALLLARMLAGAESDGRLLSVLKILLLQVLLFQRQGHPTQALHTLIRALALAEPEGYLRSFVEAGAPLLPLLVRAIEERQKSASVISQAFSLTYAQKVRAAIESAHQGGGLIPSELLSTREYEIVRLIAAGFSNQQIAEQLIIALSTVKWHIRQIYTKLNVNSRTQMLASARAQGWL